jgi:hypothetical protein
VRKYFIALAVLALSIVLAAFGEIAIEQTAFNINKIESATLVYEVCESNKAVITPLPVPPPDGGGTCVYIAYIRAVGVSGTSYIVEPGDLMYDDLVAQFFP